MTNTLQELAQINIFGAPFLFAYGVTWIVCGILWMKVKQSYAAIATLFQGMIALPIAFMILYLIGAFEYRPDLEEINQLSLIISMSQLLILPLLIAFYRKKYYTLIPFVFSGAGAIHFLFYSWLYQTIAYIIMSIIIAFAIAIVYGSDSNKESISNSAAAKVSFFTGLILIVTGTYFVFFL